jgi:RND superfamily putative drug exporter
MARLANLSIADWVITRRHWVVGGWLLVSALLLPHAIGAEKRLDVSASVSGSESERVQALLANRFQSAFPAYAVLVVAGAPSPATADGRVLLDSLRQSISRLAFVGRTFSYIDAPDSLLIGPRGETYLLVGLEPGGRRPDELVPMLRQATESARNRYASMYPSLSLSWTGEIALNYDLRRASAADAQAAERRVLPVTLVLLVLAFGAVAAAVLPLVAGTVSISLALGGAVLLTRFWPLSILLQNVVAMLGLGLGIDYALLVVGRFREALAAGKTKLDAARDAASRAGHTILLSGASVGIAFAALLFVPVDEIRSIAVGGLLVITVAVLLATTLLPALLALVGPRINAGRIRRLPFGDPSRSWRRWGAFVCAHPWAVLVIAGAPLGALALQSVRMTTDLPRGDWLPREMESSRGLKSLTEMGASGVVNAVRLVVHFPDGRTWDSPEGWAALSRASATLAADGRVARVRSLPVVTGLTSPNLQLLDAVPAEVRGSLVSADGRLAMIEVMPSEGAGMRGATELVREVRAAPPGSLTGLAGSSIEVGGLPALNVDYEASTAGRFGSIVLAVTAATFLALMVGFRSVLVALKAIVLNLFSVAVAFGAVVLVFQDGLGIGLLGLSGPLGGNFPAIPLLVFCVVFGLSMDYEVFLVARVAEARASGMSDDEAIAEGLARTGGLITSAAAIMIAVFAAFVLGDFVLIKILGFALAVAVLVDATVMRVAIGPALLKLGGRWNWWPGETYRLVRSLPKINVLESPTAADGRLNVSQPVS